MGPDLSDKSEPNFGKGIRHFGGLSGVLRCSSHRGWLSTASWLGERLLDPRVRPASPAPSPTPSSPLTADVVRDRRSWMNAGVCRACEAGSQCPAERLAPATKFLCLRSTITIVPSNLHPISHLELHLVVLFIHPPAHVPYSLHHNHSSLGPVQQTCVLSNGNAYAYA